MLGDHFSEGIWCVLVLHQPAHSISHLAVLWHRPSVLATKAWCMGDINTEPGGFGDRSADFFGMMGLGKTDLAVVLELPPVRDNNKDTWLKIYG